MKHTTKRALAIAASTAVAVGGSVALAAPAQAAPAVWDAVAQCESSGNWSINTGNGYYGGLQFSASTWRHFGGTEYAPNAHQATKAQQIAIAQRTLAGQGPGAWPTCGKRAGLTKANGGANASATAGSTQAAPATQRSATPTRATTVKAVETAGKRFVTVKSGDTLSKIAAAHGVSGGWQTLWSLNKSTISNPNLIFVGQPIAIG